MRNEVLKAMEILKDKECSINVQNGIVINEMLFVGATIGYDEREDTISITTQLAKLSLNTDDCIEVQINEHDIYLQFEDGLEFEINFYTKEEL